MAENATQIRLHLYLRSDHLTPEQVSEELNVAFDECHRIGEPRAKTRLNAAWWEQHRRFWDEHWWILHEVTDSSLDRAYAELPVVLDRLLKRVEGSWQAFARLASGDHDELSVVISSNGYPGMGLASEILQRIARLKLSVDFDLYCEPDCQRVHAD